MCLWKQVNNIVKNTYVSSGTDSLDIRHEHFHPGYAFAVATKEVPWKIQLQRLKEVMPWK